jgi:outer membrane protein assembly factor BamB
VTERQAERGADGPAAAVPVIDLDVVGPADAEPAPRPRAGRPVMIAALAVTVLVTLVAAAAPRAAVGPLLSVPISPAATHLLSPDALFVADVTGDGVAELRRHPLGGGPAWSTPVPAVVLALQVQADAQVVVAMNADESTTAVDARTGLVLWRAAGTLSALTADAALLARYAQDRKTAVLRRLSLRDGAETWTHPIGVDATWRILTGPPPRREPDRVVVVGGNGTATTLRFDTGAAVARAELGVALRQWEGNFREDYAGDFTEITSVGDSLYVVAGHDGTAGLTAYDGGTLTARWQVPAVPPGRADDCGPVVCVTDLSDIGADPGLVAVTPEIVALDTRTGARRWAARTWQSAAAVSGDRLLAVGATDDGPPRRTLLDAATGRVVATLAAGEPVDDGVGGRFVHADSVRPGQVWVRSVDLASGASSVVGSIDRVTTACDGGGAHLICAIPDGPLIVWRLPG